MNIHEYQSKAILREHGVAVPDGIPAFSVDEAVKAAGTLGLPVVVKTQIHAGGRGKAGGVKLARDIQEVQQFAQELLGKTLVTKQTGPEGKVVHRLLIEKASNIKKEYYVSIVVDRESGRAVLMASEEGGMEIEKVASEMPEKILKEYIDPAVGLLPFQTHRLAYAMHFNKETAPKVQKFLAGLYEVFVAKDCLQVEINPLVLTAENEIIALDAKLNFDDSALFRHPDIVALKDASEEELKEARAAKAGLNYVNLGGDVACMVNGAGLAMATVDIIKYFGGEPANFLDVGGDSTPEKIAEAFRIMLDGGQAKGIFVNIFGGINKCDAVAQGIVDAAGLVSKDGHSLPVPVVVRLEGTNVERGREILAETPIQNVFIAETMASGAQEIVRLVKEMEQA